MNIIALGLGGAFLITLGFASSAIIPTEIVTTGVRTFVVTGERMIQVEGDRTLLVYGDRTMTVD